MRDIRAQLRELDARFASAGFKFYFVREPDPHWQSQEDPEQLVKHSKRNVLIETLFAGTIGLPSNAGPIYTDPESKLPVLHPSLLPLTKIKRWTHARSSTRLRTLGKRNTDQQDIVFMLAWLNTQDLKIRFSDYAGADKAKLLRFMATFLDHHKLKEDEEVCQMMKSAMYDEDWEAMLNSEPMEAESTMPPAD
ncbi:hypothetical protein K488DRAFT_83264 [Vararia minispora EC-137]|uniref:Uncharacterized protein n=1 Tax=Vararia minispora EC-137 TaxID=1314806 RepID=A0ACB8QV11_9AGAM|nr:hypothetical protein K488DRAFT_83264 [Vararia minispora EC-137]